MVKITLNNKEGIELIVDAKENVGFEDSHSISMFSGCIRVVPERDGLKVATLTFYGPDETAHKINENTLYSLKIGNNHYQFDDKGEIIDLSPISS